MILDRFSLKGRVGIVTGGGQGLGQAFCLAFADAGADIVVAELNPETGPVTAAQVERRGRHGLFVETDVTDRNSVDAMVARTLSAFGRIDFIMNNAGITKWAPAEEVTEEDWRAVMAVNLDGLFYCCQAVVGPMKEAGGGRIINIASMSGMIVNFPQAQASYNASKAAVIHLTRSLACEWAPYGIRVNAIAPGYMATPMAQPFFDDPAYGERWMQAIPMGRPGQPDELAGAAIYLASEASSYVTGEVIVVDGGYTAW